MSSPSGPKEDLNSRFAAVYEQLRRVAHSMLSYRVNATLNPTAVVHEAYGRLAEAHALPDLTEIGFKRIAARVMRQVLCDAARQRFAGKRGGKHAIRVPVDEEIRDTEVPLERVLLVSDFVDALRSANPRQASVVELLFFGGLTVAEVAAELGISESTAERDWRSARAWLSSEARRSARSAAANIS